MSPQVAWLTLQGCKTCQCAWTSSRPTPWPIARFLEKRIPRSSRCLYPGLESFPQHELSRARRRSGFGAMLWFEVKGGLAAGKKLMDNIKLWTLAENLGSVESLVTHPVTMTHADVDEAERAARWHHRRARTRCRSDSRTTDDLIDALEKALEPA